LPLPSGSAVAASEVEVVGNVGVDDVGDDVIAAATVVAAGSASDPSASLALQLAQTKSTGARIQAALLHTPSTLPT
tara:strand:+ start:1233 stop:1460 length:228 start_codon:yes stop_codon:yes gene_type:complete